MFFALAQFPIMCIVLAAWAGSDAVAAAAIVLGTVGGVLVAGLLITQIVLLSTQGQSLGKKIMAIRIVGFETGKHGGFLTNVLLRWWVNTLLNVLPVYGLVDALFIFRDDRRCIHDLIASTVVVKGGPPFAASAWTPPASPGMSAPPPVT